MNMLEADNAEQKERSRLSFKLSKPVIIGLIAILAIIALTFSAAGAVRFTYNDRVLPGVSYAGLKLGGLDRLAANETILQAVEEMQNKGLQVTANGKSATFNLTIENADTAHSLIDVDVAAGVETAIAEGKGNNPLNLLRGLILATFWSKDIAPDITIHNEQLAEMFSTTFADVTEPGLPTDFQITEKDGVFIIEVSTGEQGQALAIDEALAVLDIDAQDLNLNTLIIAVEVLEPEVSTSEAKTLIEEAQNTLTAAPYLISYTPENRQEPLEWSVTKGDLMTWLLPAKDENGNLALTLGGDQVTEFFTAVHDVVDVAPQDARFAMENNRVTEFAGSHDGVTVNDAATIDEITSYFGISNAGPIQIVVDRVEPTVTTANVNSLGITEVLGVGTSSYKGSPANRIENIRHGASKLNGILVAPNETISLVEKLGPFTVADGYLPELVIKGDEIKPEVGGGLCQIGTTTFRAVMNSGLKVVERRNHSLVVSYYNDLGNGNPGTDATIYDPSPDFKFMNDTGNYILLTTEMDETDKMLYFTFWGTSDGRQGSYEPPTVLSWSGYGATQYTETDTLAPGVEKCQSPHPGATTTFTYTVNYADGTTYEEEFFSSYRSLPKICLVGKDPNATTETAPPASESSTGTESTASDIITPVAE